MTTDDGRVAEATGLSQAEPEEVSALTGFDPSRIEALLRSLLKGEFTSLTIGFNELHACNYATAQGWSDEMGEPDGGRQTYNDLRDWVSPEERDKALRDNTVWSVQWYPDTPIGFCQLYASSLEALIAAIAMEARSGETEGLHRNDDSAARRDRPKEGAQ